MNFGANCKVCNGQIFGAPKKVGNDSYHDKCFVCCDCSKKLQVVDFKGRDGNLYCGHCYNVSLRSVSDSKQAVAGSSVVKKSQPDRDTGAYQGQVVSEGSSKFCTNCGQAGDSMAKFCAGCGTAMG
jgi:LIM domain